MGHLSLCRPGLLGLVVSLVMLGAAACSSGESCADRDAREKGLIQQVWPQDLAIQAITGTSCDNSGSDTIEAQSQPSAGEAQQQAARELQAEGWQGSIESGFSIKKHSTEFSAAFDSQSGFLAISMSSGSGIW